MTVLVTGATGNVGRYLVGHLVDLGVTVRALTRNPDTAAFPDGVEVVKGDLSVPESLDAALDGVTGVHLITFAGDDYAQIPDGTVIVDTLLAAGVTRVTLLKGDLEASPLERAVFESSLKWTALAAVEFMANMLEWTAGVKAGRLEEGFVDVPSTVVHESDIASVAAHALAHGTHDGETLWITGPEALTVRERIAIIEEVTGQTIELAELTLADMEAQWASYGFSDDDIAFMREMKTTPPEASRIPKETVLQVTGRPALDFRHWVTEHVAAFTEER